MLKKLFRGLSLFFGFLIVLVALHLALIEVGREVVVVRATDQDGDQYTRRLWVVDHDGAVWLHSAGEDWLEVFSQPRVVMLERGGAEALYKATPMPGPHAEIHAALREKYGNADRWVRFLGPDGDSVLAVRLDEVGTDTLMERE